jgi:hypothetical protein
MKDLPKSLLAKLYDYQKVCVQHGIKQLGRILIADEMVPQPPKRRESEKRFNRLHLLKSTRNRGPS